MSDNGVEITRAFVTLIPSFQGAQGSIISGLLPEGEIAKATDNAGGKAAKGFGSSFKSKLAPLMTGAALLGSMKGLYDIGKTFDAVNDTIRIGTGATGKALDEMVESAKNIGKTVPTSFESAGQSIADWNTRMGLSGKALEKVAAQTEMLKSMDMAADINKLSAAFQAFNIEGDNVTDGMDTLFRVSQATGVSMDELASSVQQTAPALKSLGFSFEQSAALAGMLDKAGLNSAQTMASMSKGLVTLAKKGEKPQEAFKRVTGELQGFIKKGDEAGALNLASKVFGTKGAPQMLAALKDSKLSFDDLTTSVGATSDTIMGVGEDTQDFAEKWTLLKNNATVALEPLGSAVFDALGRALEWLMPYIESFGNWAKENQTTLAVVAGIIGGVLTTAFLAWAASVVATNLALLASPITWVVLGITALGAALVALWTKWDEVWGWISEKASQVWEAITGFVKAGAEFVGGIISTVLTAIREAWNAAWDWVKEKVSAVWNGITGAISTAISAVGNFIGSGLAAIRGAWSAAWDWVSTKISNVWNSITSSISNGIDTAVRFVKSLPQKIKDVFVGAGTWLWEAGKKIITGLIDGIKNMFGKVKETLGKLTSWLPDWKGPAARDEIILKPAGQLVIGGFKEGLESQYGAVKRSLSSFTADLSGAATIRPSFTSASINAGGAAGGTTVNVRVSLDELATVRSVEDLINNLERWKVQV